MGSGANLGIPRPFHGKFFFAIFALLTDYLGWKSGAEQKTSNKLFSALNGSGDMVIFVFFDTRCATPTVLGLEKNYVTKSSLFGPVLLGKKFRPNRMKNEDFRFFRIFSHHAI